MTGIVREPIDAGKFAGHPPREHAIRQQKVVHLGGKRQQECRERTEGTSIARRLWFSETERKDAENQRIDDDQRPMSVSGHRV